MDWSVVVVLSIVVGLALWIWVRSEDDGPDPTDTAGDSGLT